MTYICKALVAGLVLSTGGMAQDGRPALATRISHLEERIHSSRWQVRYCLIGELDGRDPETRTALETLCEDPDGRVSEQALVRYEYQFVAVRKALFEPSRYLPNVFPVTSIPPDGGIRVLVDYCLGRREIPFSCRDMAGLRVLRVLDPARPDDAEMYRPLTVVGLMGGAEDAAALLPFLRSTNDAVLLGTAKAMIRLGHREEGVAALRRLTENARKDHFHYATEALHALREIGCPDLESLVERVIEAVDATENIQPNWLSAFLLLAAEVTTPEVLVRATSEHPSAGNSKSPTDVSLLYGEFIAALKERKWSEAGSFDKCVLTPQTCAYTEGTARRDADRWEVFRRRLPGLHRDTYDSFWAENQQSRPVAPKDATLMQVHVFSQAERVELQTIRDGNRAPEYWDLFRSRYGNAVHVSVSAPGIRGDGKQALLYCEASWDKKAAWGGLFLLAYRGDHWEIVDEHTVWMS